MLARDVEAEISMYEQIWFMYVMHIFDLGEHKVNQYNILPLQTRLPETNLKIG